MAGAGYKLFNTGDVLTAQQVNEYLQQRVVMRFANATARTTALSGVLAEGMMSYLQDTDSVEVYNGSAWVGVSSDQIPLTTKGDLLTYSTTDTRLPVGTNGQVLTADSTQATGLKWATPATGPTSWTQRKSPEGNQLRTIAYNGTNLYVAAGVNGALWTSTDGITWTSRTSGFGSNTIQKVAFGNGLFVAVGLNGTLTTSTDGVTWTARTANMSTNRIQDVHYANSLWVAVGNGGGSTNTGGIIYSSDGITWTRKSQTISTIDGGYMSVVYNGTNWIVGSYAGSSHNYIYASTPSGTWTAGTDSNSQVLLNLFYDGTRTLWTNDYGEVTFSTNANLSSPTKLYAAFIDDNENLNYYYNGRIYVAGTYWYQFSTTPASNNGVQGIKTELSPNTGNSVSATSAQRAGGLWIGATGFIYADIYGGIFTSF